jgi:hypothetical protein
MMKANPETAAVGLEGSNMNKKSTRLTILIDTPTKEKLEALSEMADLTVSQILRKLIKNHLNTLEVPNNLPPGESSNVSSHIIN